MKLNRDIVSGVSLSGNCWVFHNIEVSNATYTRLPTQPTNACSIKGP
jgi:hypothetical protein